MGREQRGSEIGGRTTRTLARHRLVIPLRIAIRFDRIDTGATSHVRAPASPPRARRRNGIEPITKSAATINPHSAIGSGFAAISRRDSVPWRFSDAGPRSAALDRGCRHPKIRSWLPASKNLQQRTNALQQTALPGLGLSPTATRRGERDPTIQGLT